MKTWTIITSLALQPITSFAQQVPQPIVEIKKNWSYTPLETISDGKSTVYKKSFSRYINIGLLEIPIAQTQFVYLKNPKEKTNLKELAYKISKSFGTSSINTRSDHSNAFIEGDWDKINRHIKIQITKKSETEIVILTSFSRKGLNSWLIPEINSLHSLLESANIENTKTSSNTYFIQLFQFLGIRKVHAENKSINLGSFLSGGNITTGSTPTNPITTNIGSVTSGLSTLNESIGGLNTNVTTFNTNISNINTTAGNGIAVVDQQAGALNNNLNNLNTTANTGISTIDKQATDFNQNLSDLNSTANTGISTIDKQATDFNKNVENINNTANNAVAVVDKQATDINKNLADFNKNYANTNANWAETNKILAKTVDPNHMAKVAFYTAAGAALGSVAVSLAIDGISAGISFLHELFTGTKKKKLEWEDFQKAMQIWDTKLNELIELEKVVDQFINAFAFFENSSLGNDYVKNLQTAVRDMKFDRDIFLENFKNSSLPTECRRVYYNAADEMDGKVKEYDKILNFISNNSLSLKNPNQYFCTQLKDLQRKVLATEVQMQDLRLRILKAENQLYTKQVENNEENVERIEEINDDTKKTLKTQKKVQDEMAEKIKTKDDDEKARWITACVDAENPEGQKIKTEIGGGFAHFFKAKGLCKVEYDKVKIANKGRTANEQKGLSLEQNIREELVIADNPELNLKLSDEQMSWLNRIHVDAYCYQYVRVDENKIPAKCKEYPEILYSTALSKGSIKAQDEYKKKCESNYVKGLEKLASSK